MTSRFMTLLGLAAIVALIVLGYPVVKRDQVAVPANDEGKGRDVAPEAETGSYSDNRPRSALEEGSSRAALAKEDIGSSPRSNGIKQEEIDWQSVEGLDPIPRAMPAGESDHAYGAGFARAWVERSLGGRTTPYFVYAGSPLFDPKPLILQIISESKKLDDSWAHGLEYDIRQLLATRSELTGKSAVSRVFCNTHGCLVYSEFEAGQAWKMEGVLSAIAEAPWRSQYGIVPENLFLLSGARRPENSPWVLSIVYRHPRPIAPGGK